MTTPHFVVKLALQASLLPGSPVAALLPFEIRVSESVCSRSPHVEVDAGVGVFGGELLLGGEVDLGAIGGHADVV